MLKAACRRSVVSNRLFDHKIAAPTTTAAPRTIAAGPASPTLLPTLPTAMFPVSKATVVDAVADDAWDAADRLEDGVSTIERGGFPAFVVWAKKEP